MRKSSLAEIVKEIGQLESGLKPALIAESIEALRAHEPQLARLLSLIQDEPRTLTSGHHSVPPMLSRLIRNLVDVGAAVVQLPRCADCGSEKPLVAASPNGRVCNACGSRARKRLITCSTCRQTSERRGEIAGHEICRNCWRRGESAAPARLSALLIAKLAPFPGSTETIKALVQAVPRSECFRIATEIDVGPHDLIGEPQFGSLAFASLYDSLRRAGAALPARVCGHCGQERILKERLDGLRTCSRCWSAGHRSPCDGCGNIATIGRVMTDGRRFCQTCVNNLEENIGQCVECGSVKQTAHHSDVGPVCKTCWRRTFVDTCMTCGSEAICRFAGTDKAICEKCALPTEICRSCGVDRLPHIRYEDGTADCATCSPQIHATCHGCGNYRRVSTRLDGNPFCMPCAQSLAIFRSICVRCGTRDNLSVKRLCHDCKATDLLESLFENVHDDGQTERVALMNALRTATSSALIALFRHNKAVHIIRGVLERPGQITHDSLSELGTAEEVLPVRSYLVEHAVLPPRDEHLARLEAWIERSVDEIEDDAERRAYLRFARWKHLNRFRQRSIPITYGQSKGPRTELRHIFEFLAWLRKNDSQLTDVNQALVDRWRSQGPMTRMRIKHFLDWTRVNKITSGKILIAGKPKTDLTVVGLSTEELWALLDFVLDPENEISGPDRMAAALLLLFGIREFQIVKLKLTDVIDNDGRYSVRLGTAPLDLPPTLTTAAELTIGHRRASRLMGATVDNEWLFPGHAAGQHLSPDGMRGRLAKLGIRRTTDARKAALTPLAIALPPPVLSRLLGISLSSAVNWSIAVSASNSRYAAAWRSISQK
jgi:integrase